MSKFSQIILGSLGFSVIACGALAQPTQGPPASMSHISGPADKEFLGGMQKMQRDMAGAPMTGDTDQDFVAMMLPHHKGAVAMAKVELQYGKDPMLRKMARDIVISQDKEIDEMQAWQTAHMAAP